MIIEDKYLSGENTKDGDLITFLDAGTEEIIDNKFKPGTKKTIYNFSVDKEGKSYIYSPNFTTMKRFLKAYGKDTLKWIGKKFQIKKVLTTSGKYAIMPDIMESKP